MFLLTFLEVHFSTIYFQIDRGLALSEKWNILQTFLAHGDKRPQKYFYFDQGEGADRTGERGKTRRKLLF